MEKQNELLKRAAERFKLEWEKQKTQPEAEFFVYYDHNKVIHLISPVEQPESTEKYYFVMMPQSEVQDYVCDDKSLKDAILGHNEESDTYYITHSQTESKYLHFTDHLLNKIEIYKQAQSCIFFDVAPNEIRVSACFAGKTAHEFRKKLADHIDQEITFYITHKNHPERVLKQFTFSIKDIIKELDYPFSVDFDTTDCDLYTRQFFTMRRN